MKNTALMISWVDLLENTAIDLLRALNRIVQPLKATKILINYVHYVTDHGLW